YGLVRTGVKLVGLLVIILVAMVKITLLSKVQQVITSDSQKLNTERNEESKEQSIHKESKPMGHLVSDGLPGTSNVVESTFHLYPQANPRLVLYNKMPKCGSNTMEVFMRMLSNENNYTMIKSPIHGQRRLDKENLANFVNSFGNYSKEKCIFDRHIQFVNFQNYGFQQPIYFNLIREPFEQALSKYYYLLDKSLLIKERNQTSVKRQTFEQCVKENMNNKAVLDEKCSLMAGEYIEWFCGHEPECSNMEYGIPRAKQNIEKYHMLIGLTEEYNLTLKAMEHMLPSFFRGIGKMNPEITRENAASKPKRRPSDEIIQFTKNHLKYKYDMYNYVKQMFYVTLAKLNITQHKDY
ncbi:unnamed protein product, partial [Owenia fusiformis]